MSVGLSVIIRPFVALNRHSLFPYAKPMLSTYKNRTPASNTPPLFKRIQGPATAPYHYLKSESLHQLTAALSAPRYTAPSQTHSSARQDRAAAPPVLSRRWRAACRPEWRASAPGRSRPGGKFPASSPAYRR